MLFYSDDLESSLEYYNRNTGFSKKMSKKHIEKFGFHDHNQIIMVKDSMPLPSQLSTYMYYDESKYERYKKINDFIKSEVRNIQIKNILS